MSYYYFIVDEDRKEYFICGNSWYWMDASCIYNADAMYAKLVTHKLNDYAGIEEGIKSYFKKISIAIANWCKGKSSLRVMGEDEFGDRYFDHKTREYVLNKTGAIYGNK